MMMATTVHKFPGPATRFRYAVPIDRHRDVLALIDNVFATLRPLVRPLMVEITQVVMDLELGLPHPKVVLDTASVAVIFETPGKQVIVESSGLAVVRAEGRPLTACVAARHDAPNGNVVAVSHGRLM